MGTGLTTEEIERLKAAKSSEDWRRECERIKDARNGEYPRDWWSSVIQTGVYVRTKSQWGASL